jgi:hypothetical protein
MSVDGQMKYSYLFQKVLPNTPHCDEYIHAINHKLAMMRLTGKASILPSGLKGRSDELRSPCEVEFLDFCVINDQYNYMNKVSLNY